MANSFDFELKADDQVSQSIHNIDEAVKKLLPSLDKTRDGLRLGGQESVDGLGKLNTGFQSMSQNARDGVQFIGDMVPPLKMVAGLTVGLGGAAKVINIVKNGIEEFVNGGYRVETTAKNIGMATQAFQRLTGAMVENGSQREAAESSISSLYKRANDAVQGRDNSFLSLLASNGIGISKTQEGVADVNKLLDDMQGRLQTLSPALQAVFGDAAGLSPDMLNYLRQSTDEIQRLKDQAERDGLIFSDKSLQNVDELRKELNRTAGAWDGLKMRMQAGLGEMALKDPTRRKLETARNKAGQDQSIIDNIDGDEKFKAQLSKIDKIALSFGVLTDNTRQKYQAAYGPRDQALQLQRNISALYPPQIKTSPAVDSTNAALGLRNNNPGNLRAAPNGVGREKNFVKFATPTDGLAALSRQLMLYGDRGNNTLDGIIHTYAPRTENNTQAYIKDVAQQTGFDSHQRLNMHSPAVLSQIMTAIIQHENGSQPFNTQDIINSINRSINDARWSGSRNQDMLSAQRAETMFDTNKPPIVASPQVAQPVIAATPAPATLQVTGAMSDHGVMAPEPKVLTHPPAPGRKESPLSPNVDLITPPPSALAQQSENTPASPHKNIVSPRPNAQPVLSSAPVIVAPQAVAQPQKTGTENTTTSESSIVAGMPNNATGSPQTLADVLASALKDNKTMIEITLVNSQTGEKKMLRAQSGGKVTTSMQY
ncbi:hypothetical protein [Sodalis sp. C49]|uniref:hypothetical protein n=1 Tax=Sodalis sp. C49 TaxID=3228929 RepID=UPI003965D5A4